MNVVRWWSWSYFVYFDIDLFIRRVWEYKKVLRLVYFEMSSLFKFVFLGMNIFCCSIWSVRFWCKNFATLIYSLHRLPLLSSTYRQIEELFDLPWDMNTGVRLKLFWSHTKMWEWGDFEISYLRPSQNQCFFDSFLSAPISIEMSSIFIEVCRKEIEERLVVTLKISKLQLHVWHVMHGRINNLRLTSSPFSPVVHTHRRPHDITEHIDQWFLEPPWPCCVS